MLIRITVFVITLSCVQDRQLFKMVYDCDDVVISLGGEDDIDETSAQEDFEDKVKEVIEGTTQKR